MAQLEYSLFNGLKKKRIILASTSPRRREILNQIGLSDLEIISPDFEEDLNKSQYTPQEYVQQTAVKKAESVVDALDYQNDEDIVIISADTIIEHNGIIYEKPQNKSIQFENLKQFRDSNTPLTVITGICVIAINNNEGIKSLFKTTEKTKLYFDELISDELIQSYVNSEDGLKVAGGFKIQALGALLIKKIDGDYYNVVGLPIRASIGLLEKAI